MILQLHSTPNADYANLNFELILTSEEKTIIKMASKIEYQEIPEAPEHG